ncbi:CAP domain-containing protein [Roseimaritima sediminicola]|uniref:CAP domain-containing protein n=1 Tax=Roseimaritima sediminicola TaxID=2662066 RepID=UPI0012984911|nr:CAP domain-containing protein [Roseimaritima sediminicola]
MYRPSNAAGPTRASKRRRLQLETLETRQLLAGDNGALDITPHSQLLIELINRARENPVAEAGRYGIGLNDDVPPESTISSDAKQPLAPHQALVDAAMAHSLDMLERDYFAHNSPEPNSTTPSDRAIAAGYPVGAGENIGWGGTTGTVDQIAHVYVRHERLFRSVGHRINMLYSPYREVGTGVQYGVFTAYNQQAGRDIDYNASMATEMFGSRGGNYFITGVAFDDSVTDDAFYDIGEALGGLAVQAESNTGNVYQTTTADAGGYALEVPEGTYTITFTDPATSNFVSFESIIVSGENEKVDLDTSASAWMAAAPTITTEVQLDRDLELRFRSSDSLNWGGWQEKWIFSNTNDWYFITPNGNFYQWDSSDFEASPLVATLSASVYADTSLLHSAYDRLAAQYANAETLVPQSNAIELDSTYSLSISPAGDYFNHSGLQEKWVRAANGTWYTIRPSGDFHKWNGGSRFTWLGRVETSAYDNLYKLASASLLTEEIAALDESRNLNLPNNIWLNWGGLNEKWIASGSNTNHYITPDGKLYHWHGGGVTNATQVATIDTVFYQHLDLLTTAFG